MNKTTLFFLPPDALLTGALVFVPVLSVLVQEAGRIGLPAGAVTAAGCSFLLLYGRRGLAAALLGILFCGLFQFSLQKSSCLSLPFPGRDITALEGRLAEDPAWMGPRTLRLSVRISSADGREGTRGGADGLVTAFVSLSGGEPSGARWVRGDRVFLAGRFGVGEEPVFLARSVRCRDGRTGSRFRKGLLETVRRRSRSVGPVTEILLPALFLGMDHRDKKSCSDLFRESGTAHIMALSGFHAGLIGLLLLGAGSVLFGRRGGYLFSAAGLLLFLWTAGLRPSLIRAVVMYLFFTAGRLIHRRYAGLPVLAIVFLLTAPVFPLSVHTLSSRLSYTALAGIFITGRRLNTMTGRFFPSWLRLPVCASLGAQLWTAPLVLLVFGCFYPAGIAASLVLTPLVTLYLYIGILYLLVFPVRPAAFLCSRLILVLERGILAAGGFFSEFPPIEVKEPGPGSFLLFLFPVLLLELYRPGRINGKRKTGPQLRFHSGNKGAFGDHGTGAAEAMGTELSDQQRSS